VHVHYSRSAATTSNCAGENTLTVVVSLPSPARVTVLVHILHNNASNEQMGFNSGFNMWSQNTLKILRKHPQILYSSYSFSLSINPLSPELNPICYLLALIAHDFLHVSRIRVQLLTLRLLMSYIYGAPILDVSRSHTMTQHRR
jgi:hypothetical protein